MGPTRATAVRRRALAALAGRAPRRWREGTVERSLVWMLGSPRTGSTWLLNLLKVDPRVVPVDEPAIGSHLGLFGSDVMGSHPSGWEESELLLVPFRRDDDSYFFCGRFEDAWRPALRRLLLARFDAHATAARRLVASPLLVLKEPAGSQAAELLLSVLPGSRLLFLLRDGRDVIDSEVDAVRTGGWLTDRFGGEGLAGHERLDFIVGQAHRWVVRTRAVQDAYDRHHPDRRLLVRYEDLLDDTERWVTTILDWMGADVGADSIAAHVDKLRFDALPAERTGGGRFARAATPGLWRTNLTSEEQSVLHRIMGDTLEASGYVVERASS
jgi:hypothetical protein